MSKRLGKRALLKRNANENMSTASLSKTKCVDGYPLTEKNRIVVAITVPKSSGTMHGLTHKAKERTPFRTAHVPGQRMREFSNVSVIDGKVKQKGLGRFRNT